MIKSFFYLLVLGFCLNWAAAAEKQESLVQLPAAERTRVLNETLTGIQNLLPDEFKLDNWNLTEQTNLASLYFQGNESRMNHQLEQQYFRLLGPYTLNKGNNQTETQVLTNKSFEKMLRDRLGAFRFYALKWLGKKQFDQQVQQAMQTLDTNNDTRVDLQEFKTEMTKAMQEPIIIPSQYRKVCAAVQSQLEQICPMDESIGAGKTEEDQFLVKLVSSQLQMCQSGFSWLMLGFERENCLLAGMRDILAAETQDKEKPERSTSCRRVLSRCLPKQDFDDKRANASDSTISPNQLVAKESNNSLQSLFKRGLFGGGGPALRPMAFTGGSVATASFDLTAPRFLTFCTILADGVFLGTFVLIIILAVMGSFWVAAAATSQYQMKKYWHGDQMFERWSPGYPLPPCGTPFIFWNPTCGALHSKRARTCIRGQPLRKEACRWWWTDGSRSCNVYGCQTLCMDVSASNCPTGWYFNLTYDASGYSAPSFPLGLP